MIKTGSDFSGVGAFDQALDRLGIKQEKLFACDMDKYARQTYIHNYGEPDYYPENVYDRKIPKESLDIYMTSPPCQAFSLAGKRKGENDDRGILFYNSHEFIQKNKPRYFIFENVKGLLSDDNGRTFNNWCEYLGGKSVNGNPVIFPLAEAVPYHIYWKVLNAKDFGVPQNRERVFIIGIRDDKDNNFGFPKPYHLTKRLKDVLEPEVDEKYFLSDKMISYLHSRSANFNNGKVNYKTEKDTASCLTKSSSSLDISDNIIKVGNTNPSGNGMNGNVFSDEGLCPTLTTNKGEGFKIQLKDKFITNPKMNNYEHHYNHSMTITASCYKEPPLVCNVRRLTPRECFRLMDFPDTFTWPVSDSQAYKQAGNSIVVNVLAEIIKKLNL